MAELKTKVTKNSPQDFITTVENKQRREDAQTLLEVFHEVTGYKPELWGNSIIGYGKYHYKSERSRQEGDWPLTGFSPRKANMTIYIMPGFKNYSSLMEKLGKYKTSVSCLYFNKLTDLHLPTLKKLIKKSVVDMKKLYPNHK